MHPSVRPQFEFESAPQAGVADPASAGPLARLHHCRMVVVGPHSQIEEAHRRVADAIHGREIRAFSFRVASNAKLDERGVRFHFDIDDAERKTLTDIVRTLCQDVRLRYVRLEPVA